MSDTRTVLKPYFIHNRWEITSGMWICSCWELLGDLGRDIMLDDSSSSYRAWHPISSVPPMASLLLGVGVMRVRHPSLSPSLGGSTLATRGGARVQAWVWGEGVEDKVPVVIDHPYELQVIDSREIVVSYEVAITPGAWRRWGGNASRMSWSYHGGPTFRRCIVWRDLLSERELGLHLVPK
jgi:hypothetical protein